MSGMLGPALRMVVSLGIVLALMYIAARLLNRTRGGGAAVRAPRRRVANRPSLMSALPKLKPSTGRRPARRRPRLEVIARQQLGKTASVAVVRVADRTLLLGVTDSAVQLLSEMDAALFDENAVAAELALVAEGTALADDVVLADDAAPAHPVAPSRAATSTRTVSSVSVLDLLRERTVRRA